MTHGLLGVLIVRAGSTKNRPKNEPSPLARSASVSLAAMFPDIDYALFWLDPYRFITQWHRGITHSLLMVPLWSILLGMLFALIARQSDQWKAFATCCALGLVSHIVVDVITIYGTQLLAPISSHRFALNLTFDLDPWFALVTGIAVIGSFFRRVIARWGIGMLVIYLALQAAFQQVALSIAKQRVGSEIVGTYAIPQPISPFHWKLVIEAQNHFETAYLKILSWESKQGSVGGTANLAFLSAYRSTKTLDWKASTRFGESECDQRLSLEVWQHRGFSGFRRFASLPFVYRIDHSVDQVCVWFADLRHILPQQFPPFRYGMCRFGGVNQWKLFRLKRFTTADREPLPETFE